MTQATLSTAASLPAVAIIDPSRGWLAIIHPCGHIDGSAEAALEHLSRQNPGPAMQSAHTLMLAALRLALRGRTLDVPPHYEGRGYVVLRSLPLDAELHRSENAEPGGSARTGGEAACSAGWPVNGAARVLADVAAERRRQMSAEGWTLEHDDQHADGEMAKAAACYAATGAVPEGNLPPAASSMMTRTWPWSREWWKPRGGRADLVRAAALLVAEIERLDRKAAREAADAE